MFNFIKYGYIDGSFTPQEGDVIWNFDRYNENQTTTSYQGIKSARNLSGENIVIIGDNVDFREWLHEFEPDV